MTKLGSTSKVQVGHHKVIVTLTIRKGDLNEMRMLVKKALNLKVKEEKFLEVA